jgi:hypothetical protein
LRFHLESTTEHNEAELTHEKVPQASGPFRRPLILENSGGRDIHPHRRNESSIHGCLPRDRHQEFSQIV